MGSRALWALAIVATLALSGCSGASKEHADDRATAEVPWGEEIPDASRLASVPYYTLRESTSFLAKGTEYARYIIHVEAPLERAMVFFTTTNGMSQAPAPSIHDDVYHYEFMQIRPLGGTVEVLNVDAGSQFRHGNTGNTFTLTYIYGKGADYQYLAPFEGDPRNWLLEPGFYELVIATDERLTVGINIDLGSPYWRTLYHPQELGSSRAAALYFVGEVFPLTLAKQEEYRKSLRTPLVAGPDEVLNLFAFADLIYDARAVSNDAALAVEARGEAKVRLDASVVSERLAVTTVQSVREEAFAYAALFNAPGPMNRWVEVSVAYDEMAAVGAVRVVQLLVFAIATQAEETASDLPQRDGP